MALKSYNPRTPSQRQLVRVDRSELHKGKPVKNLTEGLTKSGGRNNTGRITSWHRGGGHKRMYRLIDFKRDKDGVPAKVNSVQYDPNRSARIALLYYADGEKRYILAPDGLQAGDEVVSGNEAPPKLGCCMPLKSIPLSTEVHAIENITEWPQRYLTKNLALKVKRVRNTFCFPFIKKI